MAAVESSEHTCVRHRVLRMVQRRVKPAPPPQDGFDGRRPRRPGRRLSPRPPPLPLRLPRSPPPDQTVYQFRDDAEPQPSTSVKHRYRMV